MLVLLQEFGFQLLQELLCGLWPRHGCILLELKESGESGRDELQGLTSLDSSVFVALSCYRVYVRRRGSGSVGS